MRLRYKLLCFCLVGLVDCPVYLTKCSPFFFYHNFCRNLLNQVIQSSFRNDALILWVLVQLPALLDRAEAPGYSGLVCWGGIQSAEVAAVAINLEGHHGELANQLTHNQQRD